MNSTKYWNIETYMSTYPNVLVNGRSVRYGNCWWKKASKWEWRLTILGPSEGWQVKFWIEYVLIVKWWEEVRKMLDLIGGIEVPTFNLGGIWHKQKNP
jgi:hypothetical protein